MLELTIGVAVLAICCSLGALGTCITAAARELRGAIDRNTAAVYEQGKEI
jgi:hypothetical protein